MRLTTLILITGILQVSASGFAQKISLSERNVGLTTVLNRIRVQTGYDFFYESIKVKDIKNISVHVKDLELRAVLELILGPRKLDFTIEDKSILIRAKIAAPPALKLKTPLRGRIVDDNGKPMAGVTVKVIGTSLVTVTNANGEYFFPDVPEGKCSIEISSVGFQKVSKLLDIKAGEPANTGVTSMQSIAATLEETIIVGYGSTDKKSLTSSVAKLTPNVAGAAPLSIDQIMASRMAGVHITPSGGAPGSATSIVIRGLSTLSKDGNSPLIVIDGIPVYGMGEDANKVRFNGSAPAQSASSGGAPGTAPRTYTPQSTFEKNPLASINPDDIASIEVLKDAYATAIYGSRGAAGVILITTKRGWAGTTKVNAQINTSVSEPLGKHKVMNGQQYAEFYNAYLKAFDPADTRNFKGDVNTDWLKEITRRPVGMNADVNISGGNDKSTYYISMGYDDQPSYIIKNDYKRYQGRINVDQQIGKTFKVGANVTMSSIKNSALSSQLLFLEAIQKAPNLNVYMPDGSYNWGYEPNPTGSIVEDLNPVGKAMRNINYSDDSRIFGNVFAEAKVRPWLTLRTELGTDWVNSRSYARNKSRPRLPAGNLTETMIQNKKWVINNLLTASKRFGSYHKINLVAGQSFESSVENNVVIFADGFGNDEILSPFAASNKLVNNAIQRATALFSVFGRLDYQFMNRYLLGATYRVDGSSRFSKNHRYIGFPSFSVGWIVNEEPFMEEVKWLSLLKLRASTGYSGTDRSAGYYGNQGQYTYARGGAGDVTYGDIRTISVSQPNNPNLKWERTRTMDVGLDLALFNSKVSIAVDYYNKLTKDAVLTVAVPEFMGFTSQDQNLGVISNKGWELDITTTNLQKKDLRWTTSFNIARNRNKILSIKTADPRNTAQDIEYQLKAGEFENNFWLPGYSSTEFFMYEWAGVDPNTGNPLWKDKDGHLTDEPLMSQVGGQVHRKPMGDAMPKVTGGLTNNIRYKGLELDFTFGYAFGHKIFNGSKANLYTYIGKGGSFTNDNVFNLSPDMLNYWKYPGHVTDIPAILNKSNDQFRDYNVTRQNSRFLEDGSFVKLKNLVLAYNLSPSSRILRALRLNNSKIFFQTENLFTITRYSGIDPEVSAYGSSGLKAGYDELTLPGVRTFRIGLKVGL